MPFHVIYVSAQLLVQVIDFDLTAKNCFYEAVSKCMPVPCILGATFVEVSSNGRTRISCLGGYEKIVYMYVHFYFHIVE